MFAYKGRIFFFIAFLTWINFNFNFIHCSPLIEVDKTRFETLKQVQVIFRHGDRTPVRTYPNDPYKDQKKYWKEGWGQLTNLGKYQQFLLGYYLRDRYSEFVDREYKLSDLYVLSSNIDRTIISAEALIAGLYYFKKDGNDTKSEENIEDLLKEWQLVPIHTIQRQHDQIIKMTYKCNKYQRLQKEFIKSEKYRKLNKENEKLVQYLSFHSGIKATSVHEIIHLQDVFFVQRKHNLDLPKWVNETIYNKLEELQGLQFKFNTETQEMKRLHGGSLLNLILKNMNKILHTPNSNSVNEYDNYGTVDSLRSSFIVEDLVNNKGRKMQLYSSHDITLSSLMNILGIFDPQIIGYSSALMIELHHNSSSKEEPFIEVFFRNSSIWAPYKLEIPMCGTPCTLRKLENITRNYISNDIIAECESTPENLDNFLHLGISSIVGLAVISILVFSVVIFIWLSLLVFTKKFRLDNNRHCYTQIN